MMAALSWNIDFHNDFDTVNGVIISLEWLACPINRCLIAILTGFTMTNLRGDSYQ